MATLRGPGRRRGATGADGAMFSNSITQFLNMCEIRWHMARKNKKNCVTKFERQKYVRSPQRMVHRKKFFAKSEQPTCPKKIQTSAIRGFYLNIIREALTYFSGFWAMNRIFVRFPERGRPQNQMIPVPSAIRSVLKCRYVAESKIEMGFLNYAEETD